MVLLGHAWLAAQPGPATPSTWLAGGPTAAQLAANGIQLAAPGPGAPRVQARTAWEIAGAAAPLSVVSARDRAATLVSLRSGPVALGGPYWYLLWRDVTVRLPGRTSPLKHYAWLAVFVSGNSGQMAEMLAGP